MTGYQSKGRFTYGSLAIVATSLDQELQSRIIKLDQSSRELLRPNRSSKENPCLDLGISCYDAGERFDALEHASERLGVIHSNLESLVSLALP